MPKERQHIKNTKHYVDGARDSRMRRYWDKCRDRRNLVTRARRQTSSESGVEETPDAAFMQTPVDAPPRAQLPVLDAFVTCVSDGCVTNGALRRMAADVALMHRVLAVLALPPASGVEPLVYEALRLLDEMPWTDALLCALSRADALHALMLRPMSGVTTSALLGMVANLALHAQTRAALVERGFLRAALLCVPPGTDLRQTLRCATNLTANVPLDAAMLERVLALCAQALRVVDGRRDAATVSEACRLLTNVAQSDDAATIDAVCALREDVYAAFKAFERTSEEVYEHALEALSHMLAVCDERTSLRMLKMGLLEDIATDLWARARALQDGAANAAMLVEQRERAQTALWILVNWTRDLPREQVQLWIATHPRSTRRAAPKNAAAGPAAPAAAAAAAAPAAAAADGDAAEDDTMMTDQDDAVALPTLIAVLVQLAQPDAPAGVRTPALYVLQQLITSGSDADVNAIVEYNVLPVMAEQLASSDVDDAVNALYTFVTVVRAVNTDSAAVQQTADLLTATGYAERCERLLQHENETVARLAYDLVGHADVRAQQQDDAIHETRKEAETEEEEEEEEDEQKSAM
jgi:hypothetical protein